jgi:hypothetical protein
MNAIQHHLKRLSASKAVLKWARTQDNPLEAWNACPRGDWLLCLAVKLGVEHRVVVLAACACARLALPFSQDERPLRAILVTEGWATRNRRSTSDALKAAGKEADEAAQDAGCYADHAGADVALAAMYAAIAAMPGQTPKGAAAACAEAAAEAAADAATCPKEAEKARTAMRQTCANIVRSKIDEGTIMRLWWEHVRRAAG